MENRKLGIAIHGAGWVAGAHARSWLKNPNVEIVSVSDIREERARQFVADLGLQCPIRCRYEEVLADRRVDVVDICTASHVHAEQAIAAAAAGKHLLVEKPMALTMDENRALRDAVARAGVKSLAGFVLRWNPLIDMLKSLLAGGAIGRVFYIGVDFWHAIKPDHHAWDLYSKRATSGSAMLLAGCHALDAARWLTGDEVVEVSAVGQAGKGIYEYEPNVVAVMKFKSGILGKVSTLLDCELPYALNVDIAGSEGTLRDNRVWSQKLFPGQTGWATIPTILPDSGDVNHHPFDGEVNHLVDCIREGRESHCSVADAYRTHELCIAIDRSVASGGQPVKLPLE